MRELDYLVKHCQGRRTHGGHAASGTMSEAVQVDQEHGGSRVYALRNIGVAQTNNVFELVAIALKARAHVTAVAGTERNAQHSNDRSVVAAEGVDAQLF
jgi:hypothetical protein